MVECKLSPSDDVNFEKFKTVNPNQRPILLSRHSGRELSHKDWDVKNAASWLADLEA